MVVLNIFHVLIAISMVALVLVQRGTGATAGAAFGSGASGTVFGSRGAGTFLTKTTWVLATLFCSISLTMAVLISRVDTSGQENLGVVSSAPTAVQEQIQGPAGEDQNGIADGQDVGQSVDLPTFQINEDEAGSGTVQQEQSVDDLPVLDNSPVESNENNQDEPATGANSENP